MSSSSERAVEQDFGYVRTSIPFLLALFTLLFLYLFHPVEMSDNSRGYLDDARSGVSMFYPPHLLHVPILRVIYLSLSSVSSCDVTCAGMIQSICWATVTIVSIYAIVLAVLGSITGALLTALMVLVSHGF